MPDLPTTEPEELRLRLVEAIGWATPGHIALALGVARQIEAEPPEKHALLLRLAAVAIRQPAPPADEELFSVVSSAAKAIEADVARAQSATASAAESR